MNIAQPSDKKNVQVNYSDFRDTGAGMMPFKQDLNLADESKGKTAQVIISFSKISPVSSVEFPFNVPSKFEHKRLAKSP